MFERFTEAARRTIFFGRWEALQRGSKSIETEHIALGALRDNWTTSNFLEGVVPDELSSELAAPIDVAGEIKTREDIPLSAESKRVLKYGAEEADVLGDRHIGNEHLLLGLLREQGSAAARALAKKGVRLETLRSQIQAIPREIRKANKPEAATRQRAAGIPEEYGAPRLLYNAATKTIIAEFQVPGPEPRKRLFLRPEDSVGYEPIGSPADDISYEDCVTCEKRPIIVFNVMSYENGSGWWTGVYKFDLVNRELSECVAKDGLTVPAPYTGGWVASILSLSDDGHSAYVKAGLEIRHENSAEMHYFIARLDLQKHNVEILSPLKHIFS